MSELKHNKVKRIFSNESETLNNEFDELNVKIEPTAKMNPEVTMKMNTLKMKAMHPL